MKIIHCCLANFYIDGYGYQENILPKLHKADGHDVFIIASTESYINSTELGYVKARKYLNEDGILVLRVPYKRILSDFITRKFRAYKGVYGILERERPDVILFHDTCAWELLTAVKYKKNNSHVKLYVDSHTDANNSATNFFSKNILHRIFYRAIARRACKHIDKILYISVETRDFLKRIYGIPEKNLEFYPLGGQILGSEEYIQKRQKIRTRLNLSSDNILMMHSGKMDKLKRTVDLLSAFSMVRSKKLRLVILGSFSEDVRPIAEPMVMADSRVTYEGWKSAEELTEYLCAADIYVQPGSQSATLQNAICCNCAIVIFPHRSHEPYLKNNGCFVKTVDDMANFFNRIADQPLLLGQMINNSAKIAADILDYRKLASRIYH